MTREPEGRLCLVVLVVVALAVLLHGCGSGALRVHATTALVAMTAEGIADDAYLAHLETSLRDCDGESVCHSRVVAEHAPAEAALTATRAAIVVYTDAIRIAAVADSDGDILAALVALAARLVTLWGEAARAFERVGLTLPVLPLGGGS